VLGLLVVNSGCVDNQQFFQSPLPTCLEKPDVWHEWVGECLPLPICRNCKVNSQWQPKLPLATQAYQSGLTSLNYPQLPLRSLFLKSLNLPSLFLAVIPTEFTLAENVLHSLQSAFAVNAKTPANKRFMITNLSK
jgi:hypothetical protein